MEESDLVHILIVDDHPVIRIGLKAMLESELTFRITGMAGSAREAALALQSQTPDVVLMDLRMPEVEGAGAIDQLRSINRAVRILVLTNYASDEYIVGALQSGAYGYLLKGAPQEEIVKAIIDVSKGIRCFPATIAQRLPEIISREELSSRELEVLTWAAQGFTNKRIATTLFISEKTARNHIASCLRKLGATDRTAAVTTAIRRGLIRLPE